MWLSIKVCNSFGRLLGTVILLRLGKLLCLHHIPIVCLLEAVQTHEPTICPLALKQVIAMNAGYGAGVTNRRSDLSDIIALLPEPVVKERCPYKKRNSN
jgi:hypothetical protein